jgi:hypothetical protein
VSGESTIPLAQPAESEAPEPASGRWVFTVLILVGLILIGVAVVLLLRASAVANFSAMCAVAPRL